MNKSISTSVTALIMGTMLVGDIATSLRPVTYAESDGYTCYGITIVTPNSYDVCSSTPAPTLPEACFAESTLSSLPIYYHTNSFEDTKPYPYRDKTTIVQNTTTLPSPITTFTQGNNFANSPMPISSTVTNYGSAINGVVTSNIATEPFEFTYGPNSGFFGEDIIQYTTQDANGTNHNGKIILKTKEPTNTADINANVLSSNVTKNSTLNNINTYIDKDSYTATITTQPAHGTLVIGSIFSSIAFQYTPTPGYTGDDTFQYTITDGTYTSQPTTGLIQVYEIQSRPIAPHIAKYVYDSQSAFYYINNDFVSTGYDELFISGPESSQIAFTSPSVSSGSLNIPINIDTLFANTFSGNSREYSTSTIIRIDDVPANSAPNISSVSITNPTPSTAKISTIVSDPENNQGTVTALVSQDDFVTSQSYLLSSSSLSGTFDTTLSTIPSGNFKVKIVAQETDVPDVCLDFGGTGINRNKKTESTQSYTAPSPFVTIEVPALTDNHKPPITGTCQIGDTLNFTIKYGPTYNIVSETINNYTCVSSPYSINPTITIPDGKYRVDVDVASGGGQLNN